MGNITKQNQRLEQKNPSFEILNDTLSPHTYNNK